MNKFTVLVIFMFSAAVGVNVYGQVSAPPGAGDKSLEDRNVKGRSVDMERARRDVDEPQQSSTSPSANKFPEIKEDFEKIQLLTDNVITLVKVVKTNYKQVSEESGEIKKRAMRLKSNLFPVVENKKKDKDKDKDKSKVEEKTDDLPQDVRGLVVAMDKSLMTFTQSPIFQNTKVADASESLKAQNELENLIKISSALEKEADKMNKATADH